MASIYKRKQDKSNKRTCWYIGYTDHNGKRKTSKGFSDKKETERLAAKLEHDVMLRKKALLTQSRKNKPRDETLLLLNIWKHLKKVSAKQQFSISKGQCAVFDELSMMQE